MRNCLFFLVGASKIVIIVIEYFISLGAFISDRYFYLIHFYLTVFLINVKTCLNVGTNICVRKCMLLYCLNLFINYVIIIDIFCYDILFYLFVKFKLL